MSPDSDVKRERWRLVTQLTRFTDKLMVALSFVWVGLIIGDLMGKLSPPLQTLEYSIWALFGIDFLAKFLAAPRKLQFIAHHWITLLSLILPAFRMLRIFQAARALQTVSLLRILTSTNRGMQAIAKAMGKRGLGYIVAATVIVLFMGAAGMYGFENPDELRQSGFGAIANAGGGIKSYSDGLWWTAMLMTTIGSQYWPVTQGGRVLCFILSLYSLGVFGYITAALASFFVEKDKNTSKKQ